MASLNWSKLINILDVGLTTPGVFPTELVWDLELSDNEELLLNYFNSALFVVMSNNEIEVMNRPSSTGFMVAMEKEIQTLIQM